MDPDNDRPRGTIVETIAVGPDLQVANLLVDVRSLVNHWARLALDDFDLCGIGNGDLRLVARNRYRAGDLNHLAIEVFVGHGNVYRGELWQRDLRDEDRKVFGGREV